MEFYDVLKKRRSIRAFKDTPIPKESLDRIAEAVSIAPSACNLQPWAFRVIMNPELRKKVASVYSRDWLQEAPAIAVAIGNAEDSWKRPEGNPIIDIDIGIAMEHFVLAAEAEGLGTCWICAYDMEEMNKALNIIPPWNVLAITPLGFAAKEPQPLKRKEISDIFRVIE